jgi:hypothetical protein
VPRSRVATRATAARRRADRLGHVAEAIGDRESCRDVRAALQHRLREQAGRTDQRARLLEAAVGWRPGRRR